MLFRIVRTTSLLGILLALLLMPGKHVLATDDTVVIVKTVPNVDIVQLETDFGMILLDSVEALSLYRFQGCSEDLLDALQNDGRILSAQLETNLESRPKFVDSSGNSMEASIRYIDASIRYIDASTSYIDTVIRYIDASIRYIDASIHYIDASIRYIDASIRYIDASGNSLGDPYRGQVSAYNTRTNQAHQIATGEGITVAVLDSGIDGDHPLLADNIIPGYDFVDNDNDPGEVLDGIDNDKDGYIDEAAGHGTHVAGVVNLVAPFAQIMPVRIFDTEGHATYFDAAQAIVYAVDHGADVINLSGNGDEDSPILQDAVDYAWQNGVLIVAAAGVNQINYPGSYEHVISVGALDNRDYTTDFSRYSGEAPTVYAPGVNIFSSYLDGNLAEWTGNSMASPFVAGEAALMLSTGSCDYLCAATGVAEIGQPVADSGATANRIDVLDAVAWAADTPRNRLKVQLQTGDNNSADQHIRPYLQIVNQGTSLPLDELTVRYWLDAETPELSFTCDYAVIGCDKITAVFNQTTDGNQYVEIQFTDAGMLYGGIDGKSSGAIQLRMNATDWQYLNETGHYSYNAATEYVDTDKVTIYHNGDLLWGVEPNGQAADMGWYDYYIFLQEHGDEEVEPPPADPAPAPGPEGLSVQYLTNNGTAVTGQISTQLQIVNDGNEDVTLSNLTLRYWFPETADSQSNCDYAVIDCANTTAAFSDGYFELGFTENAGTLFAGSSSGTMMLRIHKSDWTNYDQATHYSFNPAYSSFTTWENITLYYNGELLWGIEP